MDTRVLLVDDEENFVDAMSKRLTIRGLTVTTAFNGDQALAVLRERSKTDVVILDVQMPGMSGVETLRRIKNDFPLVEVIMLTGHATLETAIEGMRLGAYDYLVKPCDIDVLMVKVKEAKTKKRNHEQKITEAEAMRITLRRGM
jgi:DNA-binding NtrC family response regulator